MDYGGAIRLTTDRPKSNDRMSVLGDQKSRSVQVGSDVFCFERADQFTQTTPVEDHDDNRTTILSCCICW